MVSTVGAAANADQALAAIKNSQFDPLTTAVIEGAVPAAVKSRDPVQPEPVKIKRPTNDRVSIEITATSPGYLVLTDIYYPGWTVTVDGRPTTIVRANYLMRAVAVEPGRHQIEFLYRPKSLTAGFILALGWSFVLLLFWLWKARISKARWKQL
jgi:uncharacterized membrane protein YfhO